jgi:hydroxymethylbilane synthase
MIRIATRGSKLALWQAENIRRALEASHPGIQTELVIVVSTGDVNREQPLHQIGGIGLFTKEVQDAVLDGRADIAVHSLKDLPTQTHPSLSLAAVPQRGPTDDALLSPRHGTLARLPNGARVATSSLRRRAQLLKLRPDLLIEDIRGNVETRVRKLLNGDLDGLILAAAGLERLRLEDQITERLTADVMLPAVGQGALGVECRADDDATSRLLVALDHAPTHRAVLAERAFLAGLQGGCQLPIAALAVEQGGDLVLRGNVVSRDGRRWLEGSHRGLAPNAAQIGSELAARLLDEGARGLLAT